MILEKDDSQTRALGPRCCRNSEQILSEPGDMLVSFSATDTRWMKAEFTLFAGSI